MELIHAISAVAEILTGLRGTIITEKQQNYDERTAADAEQQQQTCWCRMLCRCSLEDMRKGTD